MGDTEIRCFHRTKNINATKEVAREFKVEAGRMVLERGVAIAQAARDLNLHEYVLRKSVKELAADPGHASLGHDQMKLE